MIRDDDVKEADLFTRHSIYSNCKPTIFTCNAVLNALLQRSRYGQLLEFYRFVIQAGLAPNVVTYNIVLNVYFDRKNTETALEHYKFVMNYAPFRPTPTTYRIVVKGLVENLEVDRALKIKEEMLEKGFAPDPIVYHYLILGFGEKGDIDGALGVYNELKEKLGVVSDGVVYGSLVKLYLHNGMEKEAMECYEETLGEDSNVVMGAMAYNLMLDGLSKNGKFDEALRLFDRMLEEHNPPRLICVDLGSFKIMVDEYCRQGRLMDAINVFRIMGEKRCKPDTSSFNNLIKQLCGSEMLPEAEELYKEMGDKWPYKPDEYTYILLVESCSGINRADDAHRYFTKMVESGMKPNLTAFEKVIDFDKVVVGLIKSGKIEEAKGLFAHRVETQKLEVGSYEAMLRALCETGKLDDVLKMVDDIVTNEKLGLSSEMNEVVTNAFRKEGREAELMKLFEEKEREKAKALAKEDANYSTFSFLGIHRSFTGNEETKEIPAVEAIPGDADMAEEQMISGDKLAEKLVTHNADTTQTVIR
ncbi:hypothetical protein GIB67_021460 [Kingdonia uniflora]|uniref:Pentatricopeptide repeat-containing protein n=1 Tax=Kingdonia uniflora TaxID=39325 RepID=A0A7J7NUK6_9MAGN|nr:hypothetical protein GIB67_021460 [Kingdonia uniflora]